MSADGSLVFSSTRKDIIYGDLDDSIEPRRRTMALGSRNKRTPGINNNSSANLVSSRLGSRPPLLKTLKEAETAASSAVGQLASFKDAMEDMFADPRRSASDTCCFTTINKSTSVRQQLKGVQTEAHRVKRDKMIEDLLKNFSQAESEKLHSKREDRASTASSVHTTRSEADTYARLQWQLRKKEGEKERLTVQLQTLKRTLVERKMDIGVLKWAISSMSGKASESKETLQAHKKRAEKFEVAVGKCYTQLREKDVQLANACADRESWRNQRLLLEQKLAQSEAALIEEKAVSREEKHLHEKYLRQLAEFRDEVDILRTKYECLLKQMDNQKDSEVQKIRQDLKWHAVDKADTYRDLLRATEHSSCKCQENSRRSQRKCSEKSEAMAVSREASSFQNKIRELEADKRIRDTELTFLKQNKQSAEKQHELRLKDLELRLDRSESQNKTLQNYVDYLKNSFDEVFT